MFIARLQPRKAYPLQPGIVSSVKLLKQVSINGLSDVLVRMKHSTVGGDLNLLQRVN